MNESTLLNENADLNHGEHDYRAEAEQCVRENPGMTLLAAVGFGLLVAVLVHVLRPEPKPQQRLASLLRDIEDRLHDIGEPALRKVSAFASENARAVGAGAHRGEEKVERFVRQASRRVRGFWS